MDWVSFSKGFRSDMDGCQSIRMYPIKALHFFIAFAKMGDDVYIQPSTIKFAVNMHLRNCFIKGFILNSKMRRG
jgi:hypothetical protein